MRGSGLGVVLLLAMAMLAATRTSSAAELAAEAQVVPLDDANVIQLINRELRKIWEQDQLRPSPRATDAEWCRRVFIDLIGRVPTVAELNTFLALPGDRRTKLVDLLLSDVYQTEYAQHWGTIYSNLLIGRPYTAKSRASTPLADRAAFQSYLARCFAENKPYDRLVTELVTATGSTSPGADDFNPATNYLVDKLSNDAVAATVKTGRFVLSIRMECFQCHCSISSRWQQPDFWGMNSFFRQARVRTISTQSQTAANVAATRIVDTDYVEGIANPKRAEVLIVYSFGKLGVAFPKMIDGPAGNSSGLLVDVNRREELARFLVNSDRFALTQVNRTWKHFFNYGFSLYSEHYDDGLNVLGPFDSLAHELARQFKAHGYDNRRLVRWFALSDAYGLSSKFVAQNKSDMPELENQRRFTHFYVRMLEPEVVYAAINTVRTQGAGESIDWQQYTAERNEALANLTQSL